MSKVYYSFVLSEEQLNFLRSKKYKIDRMECFNKLVPLAVKVQTTIQLSKAKSIVLQPGQLIISGKQLEKLWGIDRKTVPGLLAKMEEKGILTTTTIEDTTVRILHPIAGWNVDGKSITNPYRTILPNNSSEEISGHDVANPIESSAIATVSSQSSDRTNADDMSNRISSSSDGGNSDCCGGGEFKSVSLPSISENEKPEDSVANQPSTGVDTEKEIPIPQPVVCQEPDLFPDMHKAVNHDAENDKEDGSEKTEANQTSAQTVPVNNPQQRPSGFSGQKNGFKNFLHSGGQVFNHGKSFGNLHDHRQQNNK